jgi:hypothetical protein
MALSAPHPDESASHHELRDALNRQLTNTNFFVWIDVRPTGKHKGFSELEQVVKIVEEWLDDLDPDASAPGEDRVQEREISDPAATVKLRAIPKKPAARGGRAEQIVVNPEPLLASELHWTAPGEVGYATPEEAALSGWDARYVQLLGARVEGGRATVWVLTNDRPSFEPYAHDCALTAVGWVDAGGTGGIGSDAPEEVFEVAASFGYH